MNMATGVIVSKAKSMHGKQLNEEDYNELLHKRSVSEIAGYLKNETQYADTLKDVRENNIHRGQLEAMLRRDVFKQTMKLYRYAEASHRDYYQLHMQQIEMDLILQRIRVLISEEYEDAIAELPIFLKGYTSFDLLRLGNAHTYDELLDVLKKTMYYNVLLPYRVAKGKEGEIAYTACETALNKWYYAHVFDVIDHVMKGKTKQEVKEFFSVDVELSNLTKIYRFKRYFHAREDVIRDSLFPIYDHISARQVEELMAEPTTKGFLKKLENCWYHLKTDDSKHLYIEWYMDKYRYKRARKNIYYSQSAPLVFSSYLYLQKLELDNIINIIEGVRYQVDSEDIAKMLIY